MPARYTVAQTIANFFSVMDNECRPQSCAVAYTVTLEQARNLAYMLNKLDHIEKNGTNSTDTTSE